MLLTCNGGGSLLFFLYLFCLCCELACCLLQPRFVTVVSMVLHGNYDNSSSQSSTNALFSFPFFHKFVLVLPKKFVVVRGHSNLDAGIRLPQ